MSNANYTVCVPVQVQKEVDAGMPHGAQDDPGSNRRELPAMQLGRAGC
jgi:hypothetical protein